MNRPKTTAAVFLAAWCLVFAGCSIEPAKKSGVQYMGVRSMTWEEFYEDEIWHRAVAECPPEWEYRKKDEYACRAVDAAIAEYGSCEAAEKARVREAKR